MKPQFSHFKAPLPIWYAVGSFLFGIKFKELLASYELLDSHRDQSLETKYCGCNLKRPYI